MDARIIYQLAIFGIILICTTKAAVSNEDVEGRVGETARLPCVVDKAKCGPFHSIKWYKGKERVFVFSEIKYVRKPQGRLLERAKLLYDESKTESPLEIYPLRTEDEGKYFCEVTYLSVDDACVNVQFVNLRTIARPTSFQLSVDDGTLIQSGDTIGAFVEGDAISLNCVAGGAKPVPTVKWYNGTKRIHGRFQSEIDDDGLFIGSLPIHISLTRYDLGAKFSCEIKNDAMETPKVLWVEVDLNVSPSSVEIQIDNEVVREGDMVALYCKVMGSKPQADIVWTNDSTPIIDTNTDDNIQISKRVSEQDDGTFETHSRLEFEATRYENGVTFTCRAENPALKAQNRDSIDKSVKLNVQYAPTVLVRADQLVMNASTDFTVFCVYESNPRELLLVEWYLKKNASEEQQLEVSRRPGKYHHGNVGRPSLLVTNATSEDAGVYTCRVTNEIGPSNVDSGVNISVQYPPTVIVKTIPEGPVSEEARPNVTLYCKVLDAFPLTLTRVRWFLEGSLLKVYDDYDVDHAYNMSSRNLSISYYPLNTINSIEIPECDWNDTLYEDGSEFCGVDPSRLLLEYVFREFHGNYSCEGMNAAGWGPRSRETAVVVHYAPGKAEISYTPGIILKGHPVNFTCNVDDPGRPEATTFRWTRDSHSLKDVTTKVWQVDSASLEIEANLTCQPYNSQGEGSLASVAVDVFAKPFFITRLASYHGALMNAEEISLTCRVECSPICQISWLKDNFPLENDTHYHVESVQLPPSPASGDLQSVKSTLSWKMDRWPGRELHREMDNANYTCRSSGNLAGPGVSSHTGFRVEYPPENVSVTHESVQVVENNSLQEVECFAPSYPESTYYWLHSGKKLLPETSVLSFSSPVKRSQAGEYICVAENKHGKLTTNIFLDVLYRPECKIVRQDWKDGGEAKIRLVCRAYTNPEEVSFSWRLRNETLIENVDSAGLESRLTLDTIADFLGTYACSVNNSVGRSFPCEIDVTGVAGLIESLGDDSIILYAIIAGIIIIAIIIIILLIIFCRRQRQRGKYPDGSKKSGVPTSETPVKDASNGARENQSSPPDTEGPTFYENLPFHGIQPPANKPLLSGSDLDYADVDSTTYAYGPIPYKAESVSAVLEKKAEKEAERTGVPVRPPRKK